MNTFLSATLSILPLALALPAQEGPPTGMPSPQTEHHEHLGLLVGNWRTKTTTPAMPGVPGMDRATESIGFENAELVCNGLWLKVAGHGECMGQPGSGIWLLGYDPYAESYECIAASSLEEALYTFEGSFDPETKTWQFRGDTPMGPMRSELVVESDDRTVETAFMKGPDGDEIQCMRIVRTRVEEMPEDTTEQDIVPASHAKQPPANAALHADVGTWQADFRMQMPGAPAMASKCTETVESICGGNWTWSNFEGVMMGMPFEGHALTGHDSTSDRVVSIWIDSMSPASMRTDGRYDPERQVFEMSGTSYDETGERSPCTSTLKVTGEDSRHLRMTFGEGASQSVMTIDYRRAD